MPDQEPTEPKPKPKEFTIRLTKKRLIIGGGVLVLLIGALGSAQVARSRGGPMSDAANPQTSSSQTAISKEDAIAAGRQLSGGQCEGTGSGPKLSVSPMKAADFSHIEPYGLMIGGHVTPIDHQYYSPAVFNSPKDKYPVYAMGDATITGLEVHPTRIRLVFSVSCTFFYYYDLLTSVESGINEQSLPITVKAGQLIGHIGGQTLDFAVWDTTKPLKGFIVPEHYKAEAWKIYTADPLDYYDDNLKALTLAKYVRTSEPRSGKIDYDIDGKLIGTWFQEGTNGYAGKDKSKYWEGHLSFAPDHYDTSALIISVGYLAPANGAGDNQFSAPAGSPDAAKVTVESGLVKYDLKRFSYIKTDGSMWDSMSMTTDVKVKNSNRPIEGCALVQMTEKRKLKFETFMKTDCSNVQAFKNPRVYER